MLTAVVDIRGREVGACYIFSPNDFDSRNIMFMRVVHVRHLRQHKLCRAPFTSLPYTAVHEWVSGWCFDLTHVDCEQLFYLLFPILNIYSVKCYCFWSATLVFRWSSVASLFCEVLRCLAILRRSLPRCMATPASRPPCSPWYVILFPRRMSQLVVFLKFHNYICCEYINATEGDYLVSAIPPFIH